MQYPTKVLITTASLATAILTALTPPAFSQSSHPATPIQAAPPVLLAQSPPKAVIDASRISMKAILYKDAAKAYVKINQPTKARAALEKALFFAESAGLWQKGETLIEIANIYASLQDFTTAEKILDRVIKEGATVSEFDELT
jgi:tetratricopeptide (TPR) repeat protein